MPLEPDRIIIVVSGGLVQAVYAPAETEIQLVDFDNLREGDAFDLHSTHEPDGPPDGAAAMDVLAEALELTAQNLRQQAQPEKAEATEKETS